MKASQIFAAFAAALTLSNSAGMTANAANDKTTTPDKNYNYVALGDSIAAGFGLAEGDITKDPALVITDKLLANPVKEAYPAIFTEYLKKLGKEKGYDVKGTNLSSTAYRAEDIEKTIKNQGNKGEFASTILEMYLGEGASDVLVPYHDYYTKYLSDADLVSIQLGGNDIIMSIVPQMVFSENPILQASGTSLMLTLFGMDTQSAIGGGLQIIDANKDIISSDHFIEASMFMYNVSQSADELVDESANHVKSVIEAVKELNNDADIALVGMYNPYRTAEESDEIEEDVFAVLGKIYAAAAKAAAESENGLSANGKQTENYMINLNNKVDQINEISEIMEKYNDSDELWDILEMIEKYDDINEVRELAELICESEGEPSKAELMAILLRYDDISELQSVIDLIRNYDDISELTDLINIMVKYRTAPETAIENAIASEVAAPMAMQIAGKNVDPQMRRLNDNLQEIAAETGAVYVEVYDISPEDDFDPHPNINEHREIADKLYGKMSDIINCRMKTGEAITTTGKTTVITTGKSNSDSSSQTAVVTTTTNAAETSITSKSRDLKAGLWGDANDDNYVDLSDAVLIMQSLANPDTFHLTDQGLANADVYKNGSGITGHDAVAIQKFLLRITDKLPVA